MSRCGACRYPELAATDAHVSQYYMWYIHVAIMIYVGFGFLMTFLRYFTLLLYGSLQPLVCCYRHVLWFRHFKMHIRGLPGVALTRVDPCVTSQLCISASACSTEPSYWRYIL